MTLGSFGRIAATTCPALSPTAPSVSAGNLSGIAFLKRREFLQFEYTVSKRPNPLRLFPPTYVV